MAKKKYGTIIIILLIVLGGYYMMKKEAIGQLTRSFSKTTVLANEEFTITYSSTTTPWRLSERIPTNCRYKEAVYNAKTINGKFVETYHSNIVSYVMMCDSGATFYGEYCVGEQGTIECDWANFPIQTITIGSTCTNDCTSGSKQCSGSGYQTCGNYDTDSCTEWNPTVTPCPSGQTCSGGVCSGGTTCNTPADTSCDGCVNLSEFIAYADKWVNNQISFENMMLSAEAWVSGTC